MEMTKGLLADLDTRLSELRQQKEKGTKIVGYTPTAYMPEELVYASGALPIALDRGGDSEPVLASTSYLGRVLDTFCRGQIGYRMMQQEPLYQIPDLVIVPVTDLHVRGLADSWDFFAGVEVFRLGVPHSKAGHAFQHYLAGLNLLKERLEKLTGLEITEKRLREEIALSNNLRGLLREISLMRKSENPPISGKEFIRLSHDSLHADRNVMIKVLKSLRDELQVNKTTRPKGPRMLLTGSTLAWGDDKVVDLLEAAGASIVVEEFCEGLRTYWEDVNADDDPMKALADSYLMKRVPCAFFRGSPEERFDFLLRLVKDFNVDGVVWYSLMYRETYGIESHIFHKVLEKKNMPMLIVTSEYSPAETGHLRTRIETFTQTIERG